MQIRGADGCADYSRSKSHTKRGVQMAGMNFQTRFNLERKYK
ncbi:DUF6783 domain-containing protein [Robinsoniella peoriensis]